MNRFRKGTAVGGVLLSLVLVVAMGFPAVAWATVEDNQEPATDEEIAAALADGTIKTEDQEPSVAAESEQGIATLANDKVKSSVAIKTFSGDTMFETAVAEAKAAYPSGCSTVILAGPGDAWVDALSAAGLAGALDCPILFTETNSLHAATKQALKDLSVKNALIVGGTAAIAAGVEDDLSSLHIALEARLGGTDCYDTQMKIYEYGAKNNKWNNEIVIFATGTHYGDALSVSPVAFEKQVPIFLTNSDKSLNDAQKSALRAAASNGYGKQAVAVGGEAVISEYTLGFADFISLRAGGSGECKRLSGPTQFETSSEIAKWAVTDQGFSWNNEAFATGDSPYDALAGSVLQGKTKSVLLLASSYDSATIATAGANKAGVNTVRFFGGESAVSMRVRMGVADKLGFPYAALPGFKVYVDAGHGQNDTANGVYASGAVSGGYVEAKLTKELAGLVANVLRNEYGMEVFLNDDGGSYKLRHAEAIAQGCDAIVSIHFNAAGGSGSLSLIHNYNASYLSSGWQSQIHPYLIKGVGLRDQGKRTQEVAILSGYLPATLLEVCYIDNPSDMAQYQSRKAEVAHKIAEGIIS